jgi:1,4-dihydroxy-2-naphthoyl-CoA hydrolase
MRVEDVPDSGLIGVLGLRFTSIESRHVTASLPVSPQTLAVDGLVHHGVLSSVVESVASIAAAARAGQGAQMVGLWNRTSFLATASSGTLHATAEHVGDDAGRQLWDVRIVDDGGQLLAKGEVELLDLHAAGGSGLGGP